MLKPLHSTKEPAQKIKVGKPKVFIGTIEGKQPQQLRQSKTPRANITESQQNYLDTITGLEFHFKNTLLTSDGWNTFLYQNKKYSRTLILHIREIRTKREM